MIGPNARVFIHYWCSEMGIHLSPSTERVVVTISIELSEKLFGRGDAQRKHNCLVAIIACSPISFLKHLSKSHLRHFFTIAQYTEFGFTGQYFTPSNQTDFAAKYTGFIIIQHFFNVLIHIIVVGE